MDDDPGTPGKRADSAAASATGDLFSPVNLGRISGAIIDQIRESIHSGQLVAGSRLPSERELCARFGVSRVTVREALRVLEASGLVEIRVGAHGGAFVTAPSSQRVGLGITDLLALSGLSAEEVTEARQLLDLATIRLVCERASDEDIADLFRLCDEAERAFADGTYTLDYSAEFHIRLSQATHNGAIAMLTQSFREPILMSLERARSTRPMMSEQGLKEHRSLVEAVQKRDLTAAVDIMTEHIGRTLKRLREAQAHDEPDLAPEVSTTR